MEAAEGSDSDGTVHSQTKPSLLQIACALQDMLHDLIAGEQEAPGMREVLEFAAQQLGFSTDPETLAANSDEDLVRNKLQRRSGHESAHHHHRRRGGAVLMSPTIWSALPKDLLQRVFARLPLADIIRLQCLSKEWNQNLASATSAFKVVCADANPKLFAIISGFCFTGKFDVKVYDMKSNTWHATMIDTGYTEPFNTMNACDGGLVCFLCTSAKSHVRLPIIVCNPLTRSMRALPLHTHKGQPRMLQLVMDRNTKFYKVIVVVDDINNGNLTAELFHSETGVWTSANLPEPRLFFGYQHIWEGYEDRDSEYVPTALSPCVYDCAEREFLELQVAENWLEDAVMKSYALVHDHLFVLQKTDHREVDVEGGGTILAGPEYFISEFQGRKVAPHWIKINDHRCSNLGYPASSTYYWPSVYACGGFLLVVTHNIGSTYLNGLERLYDLSTGTWHALPALQEICSVDLMCELRWDAVP